ncbi:uncharacterized protein LOC129004032 [Macrosteles quadrilineatus]|uniref:uncharacterized protein LOC129004032 n=1 Tax=Macrosteles quadrilineatus TaxID=74068 RepID=UPI0023E2BB99|nr:uncharacterized protein LOC129004032 [Macrosteles quadrilineatus]
MAHLKLPILTVLLLLVGTSLAGPAAEAVPEPLPEAAAEPEPQVAMLRLNLLDNLLYSILTPLLPLVCELVQLLNGLTTFLLHALVLLLLDYLGLGPIDHDTIFNLLPLV